MWSRAFVAPPILVALLLLLGAPTFIQSFSVGLPSTHCRSFYSATRRPASALDRSTIRTELEDWLNGVPVYTVTDPSSDGGVVLLNEKEHPRRLAYFFASPEHAQAVFTPLGDGSKNWDVTQLGLGTVWMELLQDQDDSGDIEYRLFPQPDDLEAAREWVAAARQQQPNDATLASFENDWNALPLFVDPRLRVDDNDIAKTPFYFHLPDLLEAGQRMADDFEPTFAIVELGSLVQGQLQHPDKAEFRNILLVPPSLPQDESGKEDDEKKMPWEASSKASSTDTETQIDLTTSSTADSWSD